MSGEPGNYYATPQLAAGYDLEFAHRDDLGFYLALAKRIRARRVVDIGAGTGLLASRLAGTGYAVTAVEPEVTMLDIAGKQPLAGSVCWIHGTAVDLAPAWADLALMTGHVAQYFLDDVAWSDVLVAISRALIPGGHVAFELRNPAVEEWREWVIDTPIPTSAGTLRRQVEQRGDLVTHVDTRHQLGRDWVTTETLRFPSWEATHAGLESAGFAVVDSWGAWDWTPITPTSPEWIILARSAS